MLLGYRTNLLSFHYFLQGNLLGNTSALDYKLGSRMNYPCIPRFYCVRTWNGHKNLCFLSPRFFSLLYEKIFSSCSFFKMCFKSSFRSVYTHSISFFIILCYFIPQLKAHALKYFQNWYICVISS